MRSTPHARGRALLLELDGDLAIDDVVELLSIVRRQRRVAHARIVLVLVRSVAAPPASVRTALQDALPAILDSCAELLIAVQSDSATRDPAATFLFGTRALPLIGGRQPARFFGSLEDALAHAQSTAPHEILELKRALLRRSLPPRR
jgi:hypothetical protein